MKIQADDWFNVPDNYIGIVEYDNGDIEYYKNGKLHRLNGPAVELVNGDRVWFKNGLTHREDGPARIYSNGEEYYHLNGRTIKYESIYWFLVLTFIRNKKKIPERYFDNE